LAMALSIIAANGFMRDQLMFGTSYLFRAMGQTVDDFMTLGLNEHVLDGKLLQNAQRVLKLDI
ncbi:MAG: amidohydrolase family protein, partial [Methylobacter sp.]